MRIVSVVLLYTVLFITGCADAADNKAIDTTQSTSQPASKLNNAGTKQLASLLDSYYQLKDALVTTNAGKADKAARELSDKADSMSAFLQTDSIHAAELAPHLDTIKTEVTHITGMMDEGCEHKRIYFDVISATMYALLKKAGLKNTIIYHQYCPMAFDNKGAYWLSKDEDIKNPYFGDKMLECGETTDTLN